MNISAILVVVPIGRLDAAVESLAALHGVEVHHTDPSTGRIIAIQEAASVDQEVDGLMRIKRLPHVILAEMVQHNFEEDPEVLEGFSADSREIPRLLNGEESEDGCNAS